MQVFLLILFFTNDMPFLYDFIALRNNIIDNTLLINC